MVCNIPHNCGSYGCDICNAFTKLQKENKDLKKTVNEVKEWFERNGCQSELYAILGETQ